MLTLDIPPLAPWTPGPLDDRRPTLNEMNTERHNELRNKKTWIQTTVVLLKIVQGLKNNMMTCRNLHRSFASHARHRPLASTGLPTSQTTSTHSLKVQIGSGCVWRCATFGLCGRVARVASSLVFLSSLTLALCRETKKQ